MDRYDRIIRDVQERTDEDRLSWSVVNPARYEKVLVNPHRIIRAFTASYTLGLKVYNLLFVARRNEVHDESGDLIEGRVFELLVLDVAGDIVLQLYDGIVDRDDLWRLSSLIDEHNDKAKGFFAAFEETDVA
jgi:hypothetical protein